MKNKLRIAILLTLTHLAIACAVEVPSFDHTNDTDINHDTAHDQDIDQDIDQDTDPPINTCTITQETCRTCDLGVLIECTDENDPLHGTCEIPQILNDLDCHQLIFVDGQNGDDTGSGSKAEPLKSLANGITKASKTDSVIAVIVAGNGDSGQQDGPITINDGISILGGYDSEFIHVPDHHVRIHTPEQPKQDVLGLIADGIQTHTVISNLEITTDSAGLSGYSNYAVQIKSSENLHLQHIIATAGQGGPGADGPNAPPAPESYSETAKGQAAQAGDGKSIPGDGGKNDSCDSERGNPNSGNGGQGRTKDLDPTAGNNSGSGTIGGSAGDSSNSGKDGNNGTTPQVPSAGTGGSKSVLHDNLWTPGEGHGQDGQNGQNGNGGGGGGGAFVPMTETSSNAYSGSGGGAGGCGGNGGGGGKEGGASFGLFVESATITVHHSTFSAGKGGGGGKGGNASPGALGSPGGEFIYEQNVSDYAKAGDGGNGSPGADGSPGGGGAGGISIGAYCYDSNVTFKDSTFSHAEAAPGGQAGKDARSENRNPQNDGEPGLVDKTFGCD